MCVHRQAGHTQWAAIQSNQTGQTYPHKHRKICPHSVPQLNVLNPYSCPARQLHHSCGANTFFSVEVASVCTVATVSANLLRLA